MPKKVMVCLPAFGRVVQAETTMSLMELAQAFHSLGYEFYFTTQSSPDIAELRNLMLTLWYDRLPDAEHCLMVDADMAFRPQLVLDMLELGEPLVGCLYPRKTYPLSFVGRSLDGNPRIERGGFIECQDIGFGVTLIRRDCVTRMLNHGVAKSDERIDRLSEGQLLRQWGCNRIIRAFDKIDTGDGVMSEDYSFCRRFRESGGRIFAAAHHKIIHVGPHGYSGCFAEATKTQPAPSPYQWTA